MYRQRVIRFKSPPDSELARDITSGLLSLAGIESADCRGDQLIVRYQFPAVTLDNVLAMLDTYQTRLSQRSLHRLWLHILAYMEANQRDYLSYSGGWRRYLEDIHGRYFEASAGDLIDIRKQTWRKYE